MKTNNFQYIAIPYIFGIFLAENCSFINSNPWTICRLASLMSAVGLVLFSCSRKNPGMAAVIIFSAIGILTACTREMSYSHIPRPAFIDKCLTALKNCINDLPLRSGNCRNLLLALITADRSGLTSEIQNAFRSSGAAHLLALSGLHLGIISSTLNGMLKILGNSRPAILLRSFIVVIFSGLYTLICGAGASLVRAFLFITFSAIAAQFPHRRSNPATILLLSACIQLSFSPASVNTLSFQLSYLACIGIIAIYPNMQNWFSGSGPAKTIWNSAAMSLSCQFTTAPLVWLRFKTLPKYFLLTNLLSLPLCEVLIISSVAAITTSAFGFSPKALCMLCDFLGNLLIQILQIVASIP